MSDKQYFEQFQFDDPKIAEEFLEIIEDLIDRKIRNLSYDRKIVAQIVSVGSGVASVKLLGGDEIIPNVKVRDGLSLSPNEFVYCTAINGSLNNLFIDVKK